MSTRAGNGLPDGCHCLQVGAAPRRPGAPCGCLLTRIVGSAVVEARFCDLAAEPLPAVEFDLVHARLVLELLPQHELVLRKLATAVRLGGWLLVEDLDWATGTAAHAAPDAHRRVGGAVLRYLGSGGYDPRYGRRLPRLLRAEGLADVTAVARPLAAWADGGRDEPPWEALVDRLAPTLLGRGLLDRDDLDTLLGLGLRGIHECVTPMLVSAWGQRQEAPAAAGRQPGASHQGSRAAAGSARP